MGFLFLYLLDFNYDLKLNQVARRQTSPPEIRACKLFCVSSIFYK